MLHPRWFSFLPHSFYSALNHCRTPILFSVCEAFCISALHLLLRSLSYFFIFLFKNLLFSPSATIFRIILLPLGFLLFFSSVRFSLTLPQTPHSCFLLSKLRSFMGEAGGRLGVLFFWLWKAMNVPIDSSEILQRRVCTTLSTFTKFATAVNESLTNPSKSEVYLKRCNSFPQITLSGLPEQAFIFILRDPTACSEASPPSTPQDLQTMDQPQYHLWLDPAGSPAWWEKATLLPSWWQSAPRSPQGDAAGHRSHVGWPAELLRAQLHPLLLCSALPSATNYISDGVQQVSLNPSKEVQRQQEHAGLQGPEVSIRKTALWKQGKQVSAKITEAQ